MFRLLKNLNKKELIMFLILIVLISIQVYLELKIPDYMSEITSLVQTSSSSLNEIIKIGLYMLLCALFSLGASIIIGYLSARISANFSLNVRKKIFRKTLNMSIEDIKKFEVSSLITRTTNDITQIEMLLAIGSHLIIKAPITAIWAITKILNKNLTWSLLTLAAIIILLTTVGVITLIVMPKFKIVQSLIDKVNNLTRENLTGIRVIRAFNAEKYQTNKFDETNKKLTNQQLFNQKTFAIMSPMMYLVMHFLTLGIYFIGAYLIKSAGLIERITLFSDMIVFSSYAMQVIMSFLMLAMIFMVMPRASVSANRINEVLETTDKIKEGKIKKGNKSDYIIEFKKVSFKYPDADEYLLKNISFNIKKGETVAFIGSTGSGKSTLVNLIPRFYDVTDGIIKVDGVNVNDYKLESLWDKLGYVPQKAVLFNGTVSDNISYGTVNGKKVKADAIKDAIRLAEAEEFVLKMEDEYNAKIAERGSNISGGQKQRLSIARAIARKPEIYIFDDSFSALDYKTDSLVRKNLKKYVKGATTLIVAQRIGTIMNADKIVVLDNGECVGIGNHAYLLKNCKVYQEIAYSQMSKEELENA